MFSAILVPLMEFGSALLKLWQSTEKIPEPKQFEWKEIEELHLNYSKFEREFDALTTLKRFDQEG